MMKFGKNIGAAFAMGLLLASLSGCGKQDSSSEQAGNAPDQVQTSTQSEPDSPAVCRQCGVIDSIREVTTKGESSGLGVVGGAVVGGLLGNQVGAGNGKNVATAVGAVGGAVAGNQIEKSVNSTKSYDITVRYEDGSSGVIHADNGSTWRPGDRVRVVDGVIHSNN